MWISVETADVVRGVSQLGASPGWQRASEARQAFRICSEERKAAPSTCHGTSQCYALCTFTLFAHWKAIVLSLQTELRLTEDTCLPTYRQESWDHESKHIENILYDPDILEAPSI